MEHITVDTSIVKEERVTPPLQDFQVGNKLVSWYINAKGACNFLKQ